MAGAAVGALCASMVASMAALGGTAAATAASAHTARAHKVPNVTVTLGTTDKIVSNDPAGSYDLPSWTVQYNVYQQLLTYPPNGTKPVPDAAKCHWQGTGATVYACTVLPHQFFSNGDPVTAQDVVYSFERVNKINDPNGPASLIAPMKSVSAKGNTVTFTMKHPDATWPGVVSTAAGSIVDPKVFPFDKLVPSGKVIGSGPYELAKYVPNELAEFTPNPHYGGADVLHNNKFIVRYEESGATLVSDVQQGAVDLGYRDLTTTQLVALRKSKGVRLVEGHGIEIRYIVFNLHTQPGSNASQKLAIRHAVAYVVNRQDLAANVYKGTVKPLYSIIPNALPGHIDSFVKVYGPKPSVADAKKALAAAGVKTPVKFTLWYNINHYQDEDLATELARQLNASGLFKVSLQSAEWTTYDTSATTNEYGVFLFGWFPDYPDADDYSQPFYQCNDEFMVDHYCNASVDKDLLKEEGTNVQSVRNVAFAALQTQTAKDAPLIPLWQGGQVAAVRNGVTGVLTTLDPSYTFRFWLIGKH
ncbi:MAG: ABC transporter substrate-binding protein [Acidimicrobiales bacterium]